MKSTQTYVLLALLVFGLAFPAAGADYQVRLHDSLDRIFPDETPPATDFAGLQAARGEYESVQIVVQAEEASLQQVTCQVSELLQVGTGYRIGGEDLRLYLQGYLEVTDPSWRGAERTGLWADPLLESRPVEVPAGENRAFWLSLLVPREAPSGHYRGEITVTPAHAEPTTLPLRLRVWDFALGTGSHLGSYFFFNFRDIARAHGLNGWSFEQWTRCYDAFGQHRICTDLWTGRPVTFYREPDGSYSVDAGEMLRRMAYVAQRWDAPVINVGSGCWGGSGIFNRSVYDRATGDLLEKEEIDLPQEQSARMYFDVIGKFLAERGLEDRAYIQLWDEPKREAWDWGVRRAYRLCGSVAPWLRRQCVVGIHPYLQGYIDIFSPHTCFGDKQVYEQVRRGVSLYGPKAVAAQVTASTTGGWGNAAFYTYAPEDAYDGCAYTKWTPAEWATADKPQWLRFDFDGPQDLDGLRIVPYKSSHYEVTEIGMTVEASENGESFAPLEVTAREGAEHEYIFTRGKYRAVRLVWSRMEQGWVPSGIQPVPPPEVSAFGVREVEFLGPDLRREGDLPQESVRKAEVWEYNVGADFPSFCVNPPQQCESRVFPWLAWERGVTGLLYYGGSWWSQEGWVTEEDYSVINEQPLVWHGKPGHNGGAALFYPAPEFGLLPSVRVERMRDGFEDYDYFWLLRERVEQASLAGKGEAAEVREARRLLAGISGHAVADDPQGLLATRRQSASLIVRLGHRLGDQVDQP